MRRVFLAIRGSEVKRERETCHTFPAKLFSLRVVLLRESRTKKHMACVVCLPVILEMIHHHDDTKTIPRRFQDDTNVLTACMFSFLPFRVFPETDKPDTPDKPLSKRHFHVLFMLCTLCPSLPFHIS